MASYTLRGLDDEFWRQVKIIAATKRITIRDLIIKLLEKEIKNV